MEILLKGSLPARANTAKKGLRYWNVRSYQSTFLINGESIFLKQMSILRVPSLLFLGFFLVEVAHGPELDVVVGFHGIHHGATATGTVAYILHERAWARVAWGRDRAAG